MPSDVKTDDTRGSEFEIMPTVVVVKGEPESIGETDNLWKSVLTSSCNIYPLSVEN